MRCLIGFEVMKVKLFFASRLPASLSVGLSVCLSVAKGAVSLSSA